MPCCANRSVHAPLRMEGPAAGVHKAADAKARSCSGLLPLLYTNTDSQSSQSNHCGTHNARLGAEHAEHCKNWGTLACEWP